MTMSSDNSLGKNRTLIITLAIVLILLVNSVSLYNNIRRSQNSVNDTFRTISTTQLHLNTRIMNPVRVLMCSIIRFSQLITIL